MEPDDIVDEMPLRGVLATEDVYTGDDRIFDTGALRWDFTEGPLPFRWAPEDYGAHQGARHVGWIDTAEREGNDIVWTGRGFDPEFNDYLTRAGKTGVSIDADDETYDVVLPESEGEPLGEEPVPGQAYPMLRERQIFHDARIRAATAVDIPAFITGYVEPAGDTITAATESLPESVTHAGILLAAEDTQRWLLLQRALEDGGVNGGLWEFPGGGIEDGEKPVTAALREFGEECGIPLPENAVEQGVVVSADGVYALHVFTIAEESAYPIDDRDIINPDDPDGDATEALAWWSPEHVKPGGYHLRNEVANTDWATVESMLTSSNDGEAVMADETDDAQQFAEAEAADGSIPELTDVDREYIDSLIAHHVAIVDEANAFLEANPDTTIPALVEDMILSVDESRGMLEAVIAEPMKPTDDDVLVASAAPGLVAPPDEWFEPFDLGGPTPITITADGRVYGHLADWKSCHRSPAFNGACVKPPSDPNPAFFYSGGQVLTASGAMLEVGRLTVGGGHANEQLGLVAALEHYDDASTAGAIVRVAEDEYGIGVFGSVTADATPEQVAAMRRSPFSGDWRKERGRFRLIAAHAVNTGGFPIPRQKDFALVASVTPNTFITHGRVEKCDECGTDVLPEAFVASVIGMMEKDMQTAREELRDSIVAGMGSFEDVPIEGIDDDVEDLEDDVESDVDVTALEKAQERLAELINDPSLITSDTLVDLADSVENAIAKPDDEPEMDVVDDEQMMLDIGGQ